MQRILVATDLSPEAGIAIARACQIGAMHCATLHLLHVVPRSMKPADRALRAEEVAEMARALALRHPCLCAVTSSIRDAPTGSAIRRAAMESDADMIVIGGHRGDHRLDWLFGTTADQLLRRIPRPVLIARTEVRGPYRHVQLAGTMAEQALEVLVLAAHISGAEVELASVGHGRSGEIDETAIRAGPVDAIAAAHAGGGTAPPSQPDLLVITTPVPWIPAPAFRGMASGYPGGHHQADLLICPAPRRHRDTHRSRSNMPHENDKQAAPATAPSRPTLAKLVN